MSIHWLTLVSLPFILVSCASNARYTVATPHAPAAIGPYSQAIVSGETIYCAGQIAINPATGKMLTGDIVTQTQQVLDNLSAVLAAEGLTLDNVVKTTVYLANLDDYTKMNETYARYFNISKPARATVEVSKLPKNALVEIECIATR